MVNTITKNFSNIKIGYGNPKGDFWFIGPEEGGNADSLQERIKVWNSLGSNEHFQDLKSFHLTYKNGTEDFFEGNVKLQKTWNGIIEILFGILNKDISIESKKLYQSTELGSKNGNTLIGELFPFASRSLNDSEWLTLFGDSKKNYWDKYADKRIKLLAQKIQDFSPRLVVFYSTSFVNYWEKIVGLINNNEIKKIEINQFPLTIYATKKTLFAIVPHPVSINMNGEIKRKIGLELNKYLK